jgi:hypothetical protein
MDLKLEPSQSQTAKLLSQLNSIKTIQFWAQAQSAVADT